MGVVRQTKKTPQSSQKPKKAAAPGSPPESPMAAMDGAAISPPLRRRPAPSQFDLVVTFSDEQQARDALLRLRHERFGPDQAVLLTPGPLHQDEFELAAEALRAESRVALGIVVATELATGALLGALIGWLAGLFHFAPVVGPVWQPILIIGAAGLLSGAVVAVLDVLRWRRARPANPGAAAIALRLRGRDAAPRLAQAQRVLGEAGGQQETG